MAGERSLKDIVDEVISFSRSLVGTPYQWWAGGDLRGDHAPYWAFNGKVPDRLTIKSQGCACAGLVNLIRRRIGLPIFGLERPRYMYAGGTACWFRSLKSAGALQRFDPTVCYPKGTLLLRPYKNELDQGHVAVVYSDNSAGILYAKLIHAYPLNRIPKPGKRVEGGIRIDPAVGSSHFWHPRGYYSHVCLPKNWLS